MATMAFVAGGEASVAYWSATTNWIVSEGSLDAAIAFDTTTDDAPAVAPGGVLLVPPPSQDSPSCEITVSFKEKHEVHRVYVRSTARIYEIYYATDEHNHNKDYLCTVRCSAAENEWTTGVTEGATTDSQNCSDGTMEIPEQPVQGDSNSSDEDGWVKVKVPVSLVQDDQANLVSKNDVGSTSSSFQIHYEATAEISDASPSVSLTLRLLSLHTKTCVHIEEIYIYADPAESTSPDPPVSMGRNVGGSLLAMLVPGLMQMPKSGNNRIDNRSLSDDSMMQTDQHGVGKTFETSSSDTGVTTKVHQESTQLRTDQKVTDSSVPLSESVNDENNLAAYTRVEKVLDELVSRVGRIEAFCSRFEENMMKPLGCIETRLQRVEQQLDAFALRAQSSQLFPSRIAAPEFSFSESDSESGDSCTTYTGTEDTGFHGSSPPANVVVSVPESHMCAGLIVKAPEFLNEDDEYTSSVDTYDSVPDSEVRPGLAVNAPEFINKDHECTDSYDALDSVVKDSSGDEAFFIDGAIASALEAFLTSASIKSPNPSLMDAPPRLSNGTNSCLASLTIGCLSEGEHFCEPTYSVDDVTAPNNLLDESDMENRGCDASELGSEQTFCDDSSLLADDATHNGLIVIAPECPGEDADFIGSDDDAGSLTMNCIDDQAVSPAGVLPASSLAVFLSSKVTKSSNFNTTLLDSSLELSNDDDIIESASPTWVPLEEDSNGVIWHRWTSYMKPFEEGLLTEDPLYHAGLCGSDTADSDVGAAALGDPRLDLQLGLFSSKDLSFDEKSVSNKFQVEWSDGNSTQALVDSMTSKQKSKVEIEHALHCLTDYHDKVLDLNIALGRNWRSEVPLEVLLGEMWIDTASGGNEGTIVSGEHCDLSLSLSVDLNATMGDQLLQGVDDPMVLHEPSCLGGDSQEGHEGGKQQPFSSLI